MRKQSRKYAKHTNDFFPSPCTDLKKGKQKQNESKQLQNQASTPANLILHSSTVEKLQHQNRAGQIRPHADFVI